MQSLVEVFLLHYNSSFSATYNCNLSCTSERLSYRAKLEIGQFEKIALLEPYLGKKIERIVALSSLNSRSSGGFV